MNTTPVSLQKYLLLSCLAFALAFFGVGGITSLSAQSLYKTSSGQARFFSKAPLEDIEATSQKVSSLINTANQEVAFLIPISSFQFEKSLMQEHFNENYMESEKYPTATFQGKLEGKLNLTSLAEQQFTAVGNLTIHGVKQQRRIPVKITLAKGGAVGYCQFKVVLNDHQVKIPTLVAQKIAEEVVVTLKIKYLAQSS